MEPWLQTLIHEVEGAPYCFCRNVGMGYFSFSNNDKEVIHRVLMLSPFLTYGGICTLQSWIRAVNPRNPRNLAFSMWVSLKDLPYELKT
jgi:hypothetical protein